jgi:glycosyltransferase involved in cell wall biosynthesis
LQKKSLNILIFNWQDIKNPLGGGAEVHLHQIFSRIAKMGHNVQLISCEIPDEPKDEVIDEINIYRHGSRNTFNFHVPKLYKKFSKEKKYDIVIDDINKIPFYTPLYVKEPILAIAHHLFGSSIFREASLVSGLYVYLSEMLLSTIYFKTPFSVVSKSTLDELLKKGFKKEQFDIVHNAIDQDHLPMEIGEKSKVPIITYFGRLKKYKSPDHLLEAFAGITSEFPTAELHIAGRGDFEPELRKLTEKLNISNKTLFYGYITEEEKINLLSKSHLVVNTSMKEGWGITNLEANACGTPVICADSPGLRDSIKKDQSGDLYKYGEIKQLNKLLLKYLRNNELLKKLEQGSIEWAKRFSWDKSANEMLEIIYKTINRGKNEKTY